MTAQSSTTWIPKCPTPEELRREANAALARTDRDRESVHLMAVRWTEQTTELAGAREGPVETIRRHLAEGGKTQSVTPHGSSTLHPK